ncbi:MAG: hypothetical protein WDO19_25695, partial [Bacteroidota bacterium]
MSYRKTVTVLSVSCTIILLAFLLAHCKSASKPDDTWKAPPEADAVFNPLQNLLLAEQKGKELYNV